MAGDDGMSNPQTTKNNVIMQEFGRMMYRDYGPYAYRKYVDANPAARIARIDRAIEQWEAKYAAAN